MRFTTLFRAPLGRHKVAILPDMATVKMLATLVILLAAAPLAAAPVAAAQLVPLPRPRPPQTGVMPSAERSAPSACMLRLTAGLAVASAVEPPVTSAECAIDDAVRLEAVLLAGGSRVAVAPPALVSCSLAEAIAHWLREDVAPAVRAVGSILRSLDNYASYDCRGRNRAIGARISEHGKGNALDMRSLKLADDRVLGLTDPAVPKEIRESVRKSACARFSTVLGPGSDGYHEEHVHVDLAERRAGYGRLCRWDVHDTEQAVTAAAQQSLKVPLPRPRPTTSVNQ